jgi:hypothetical protein
MTTGLHDIPGTHREWVTSNGYTGSTDDGLRDALWRAPFDCNLHEVNVFFQGTADVAGGTAGDYFTLTLYDGTVPIATAGLEGTVQFGSALAAFSGTQAMSGDDALAVQYGTAGGTAALDMPRATFEVQYKAR